MFEFLQNWLSNTEHLIYGLVIWLMVGMILDFALGVVIAKARTNVEFSSFKMKIGIIVKLAEILIVVYFIPIGVKFGDTGITLLTIMLTGLLLSEIYSILGHIRVVDDNTGWLTYVEDFLKGTLGKDKGDDNDNSNSGNS